MKLQKPSLIIYAWGVETNFAQKFLQRTTSIMHDAKYDAKFLMQIQTMNAIECKKLQKSNCYCSFEPELYNNGIFIFLRNRF